MTLKTTLKTKLLTFIFAAGSFAVQAQETPKLFGRPVKSVNPVSGKIRCATSEYEEYLQETYPGRNSRAEFEEWLAPKVNGIKTERLARKAAKSGNAVTADDEIRIIPVVVHVVHNGDAIGVNENIADAQVLSQITVLNQDFRKMAGTPGWNDNPVGADMKIEFRMAKVDPNGNPTNGIDRVQRSQSSWSNMNSINNTLKPQTSWDPTKYFNIWVVNFGASDLLGYAQFPSTSGLGGMNNNEGPANTDGLVVGYKFFGSKDIYQEGTYDDDEVYIYGRTATHEIGHCFGLLHIDGDDSSCIVNSSDSYNDYCLDTPAASQLKYGCSVVDTCPNSPGNDMIENYMDYSDDYCMNIFTEDQKDRVDAVLQNSVRRASLLTSTVWQDTNAVTEVSPLSSVKLYPNPASTVLTISANTTDLPDAYVVYNSIGQQVAAGSVNGNALLNINVSAYANGVYFIKVAQGAKVKTLKFVKN